MTIYFLGVEGSKAIKIGFTAKEPLQRMRDLQTGQPEKLSLLGSIEGNQDAERELHTIFATFRVNGEWFEGPPAFREFLLYIAENKLPWTFARAFKFTEGMIADLAARLRDAESKLAERDLRQERANRDAVAKATAAAAVRAAGLPERAPGQWTAEALEAQIKRQHRKIRDLEQQTQRFSEVEAENRRLREEILREKQRRPGSPWAVKAG